MDWFFSWNLLYYSLDVDLQIQLLVGKVTGTIKKEAPGQVTGLMCYGAYFGDSVNNAFLFQKSQANPDPMFGWKSEIC